MFLHPVPCGAYSVIEDDDTIHSLSHLWSSLSASVLLSVLLYPKTPLGRCLAVCFMWSAATMDVSAAAGPNPASESGTHRWLKPAKGGAIAENIPLKIVVGTNIIVMPALEQRQDIITTDHGALLTLWRSAEGITFDAHIMDESGQKPAVSIVKNEFHLLSGKYSSSDRSKDRNRLAIYDPQGSKIFSAYFVSPTMVSIRGKFHISHVATLQIDGKHVVLHRTNGGDSTLMFNFIEGPIGIHIVNDRIAGF